MVDCNLHGPQLYNLSKIIKGDCTPDVTNIYPMLIAINLTVSKTNSRVCLTLLYALVLK